MADYTISNIYQGGYSSLSPKYGSIFGDTYRINPATLGLTTDGRTANIIQDASTKLNVGAKEIEISGASPEIFDAIPKQQLKEVNRLCKITGADVTLHGPVGDSAGISQQGFSEIEREGEERKISDALIRGHELDPDGNIPVTFHSSGGIPGTEWKEIPWKEKGKPGKARQMIAINKESGQMIPLREEEKYYPGAPEGGITEKTYSPEENLKIINETEWDNKLSQLFFNKERADEILQQNQIQIQHLNEYLREAERKGEEPVLTPTQEQAYIKAKDAQNYLQEIHRSANAIFSRAYEFGTEEQREKLKKISEIYSKDLEQGRDILGQSRAMHKLLNELQDPTNNLAPDMFVPIEDFAVEKSSKTFGNAAFNAYKKFGNKTPVLSIENPPAGFALSTGEDLKNLVEASRKQFAERAVEERGIGQKEAERLAEKFIGATWDVGHINMLRKYGYKAEDIVKETEKVAPLVKHIHLSDNFGFEHAELPMGMGNVPIKEMMEKLPKKDIKKVIEAISWWQHQKTSPFKETLEAFGSPMYVFGPPSWNQTIGLQQDYYGGYGMMLPSQNYQMWGSGFSMASLPTELGGQMPGAQGSRMAGRPME